MLDLPELLAALNIKGTNREKGEIRRSEWDVSLYFLPYQTMLDIQVSPLRHEYSSLSVRSLKVTGSDKDFAAIFPKH